MLDILVPSFNVTIDVLDKHDKLVSRQRGHNLVVSSGLNLIRDLLYGDIKPLTYFAIGTSNTAVSLAQTALVTEVYRSTITTKSKSAAKLTTIFYLSSGAGNGNTLREAGLFDSTGTGMYARYVLGAPIVKSSSNAVNFIWELTWS